MRTIEQRKYNYSVLTGRNTSSLLSNWRDEKVTEMCGPGRTMVCIFIAHCTFSLHIAHFHCTLYITPSLRRWLVFGHSHNRKKYGLQPKQIQSNISPNLMEVSCGAGMEIPIEMKYEKQSKQILSNFSPNLMVSVSHPPALRRFPDTLWRKKHQEAHPKVNSDAWEG